MKLVIENTTKASLQVGGLVLEPGKNDLDEKQLKLWKSLRAKGTSKQLIATKTPRWSIKLGNLMSAGHVRVLEASGADDRKASLEEKLAERKATANPKAKPKAEAKPSKR